MFKNFVTLAVFIFSSQVEASSDDDLYEKAHQLLKSLKLDTSVQVARYHNNLDSWLAENEEGQNQYINSTMAKLDDIHSEILKNAEDLRKIAENKNPDAVVCVDRQEKHLQQIRNDANSFMGCVSNIEGAVERYIVESKRQILGITNDILVYQDKFNNCGRKEHCLEKLIPELALATKEMPEAVALIIDNIDEYIKDAAGDRLKACDTEDDLVEKGDHILNKILECISSFPDIL